MDILQLFKAEDAKRGQVAKKIGEFANKTIGLTFKKIEEHINKQTNEKFKVMIVDVNGEDVQLSGVSYKQMETLKMIMDKNGMNINEYIFNVLVIPKSTNVGISYELDILEYKLK